MEEESTSFTGDFESTNSPNDIQEELAVASAVSEGGILPEEQPPNPDPQQIEEFTERSTNNLFHLKRKFATMCDVIISSSEPPHHRQKFLPPKQSPSQMNG